MIYHIKGYIVRKAWNFNPKHTKHNSIIGKTETIQGTLCYISAESDDDARQKVVARYPDFTIETAEVVSEDEILKMLTQTMTLHHLAGK